MVKKQKKQAHLTIVKHLGTKGKITHLFAFEINGAENFI
jgi:hypothetical protein